MTVPMAPRRPAPNSPFSEVPEAQDYLRESVQGYGESLKPEMLREIGATLGGLNEIGALRSGGTTVALGDVAGKYGAQIGAYAKMASGQGLQAGLEARRQKFAEAEAKRRRRAGLLKAIGSVLGAGIGFIAAGPAGAGAGYKAASGALGEPGGSDATYDNAGMA